MHVEELAKRLKVVLYTLVISTIIMMVFPANLPSLFNNPFEFFEYYDPLVAIILRTIKEQALPEGVKLIGLEFTSPIELYFFTSLFLGVAISAPVFAYEIYRFIDPALYPNERREIYPFMIAFIILLIFGMIFGYKIIVPFGLLALLPFFPLTGAELIISITDFYYLVLFLTIVTGLIFTFPVFLVILVKYRIINIDIITKRRRYVYLALMIIVFAVTPGASPSANFILFVVMSMLLEIGVFFAKRYEKGGETHRTSISPSQDEIKCKFCGKPISVGATFCPHCEKSQK
jgi:sec-independent protein translocase protein TatC